MNQIQSSDLLRLKDLFFQHESSKQTVEMTKLLLDNANLKSQLSQERLQSLIQAIYQKYNIDPQVKLNVHDGTWEEMVKKENISNEKEQDQE